MEPNNYFDFKTFLNDVVFDSSNLNNESVHDDGVRILLPLLKKTFEFEHVELTPASRTDALHTSVTFKVEEGERIPYSSVKVISIGLSPKVYVNKTNVASKPNELSISPMLYDPETFSPYKVIQISFAPYDKEDLGDEILRKQLHEKLDAILDSDNSEYEWPSTRSIIIRGIIEK